MRLVRITIVAAVLSALVQIDASVLLAADQSPVRLFGSIEHEEKSDYSHIRLRRKDNVRTMLFVRDGGREVGETQLNLDKPHDLLVPYTQFMFVSYLFRPQHERVLLVGMGGGAMVHFLKHHDPDVKLDAVEIDPAVVKIADEYFDIRSGDNVNVVTADGFEFLAKAEAKYDVIYMDAFLKPSDDTDDTGVPVRLKTLAFYKEMQERLVEDGLVVFNINSHRSLREDLNTLREAFAQVYVFRVTGSDNLVVVGSTDRTRQSLTALVVQGRKQDERFNASFSFYQMARRLVR